MSSWLKKNLPNYKFVILCESSTRKANPVRWEKVMGLIMMMIGFVDCKEVGDFLMNIVFGVFLLISGFMSS